MPAVQSSFQSQSRLEPSSYGSSDAIANIRLGLLAFIAIAGIRCLFKVLRTRCKNGRKGLPHCRPWKGQGPSWVREKSRVVSASMSASTAAKPFSSRGSEDKDTSSSGLDDKVGITAAETSDTAATIELKSTAVVPRPFMVRPPPPPPLTLPELSTAVFSFDDRRRSFPAAIAPRIDAASFIHQPNPDYIGESSSTAVTHADTLPEAFASATMPRRRSYTKIVPIGITGLPQTTSPEQSEFSPSSFPLASPSLPPQPEFPEIGHGLHSEHGGQQEIDVHGEIISALDEAGHGWKRHTRVYGGGVCLACLSSGSDGGFYGENVRPEDRRYH